MESSARDARMRVGTDRSQVDYRHLPASVTGSRLGASDGRRSHSVQIPSFRETRGRKPETDVVETRYQCSTLSGYEVVPRSKCSSPGSATGSTAVLMTVVTR
jgi:hypothetical protein